MLRHPLIAVLLAAATLLGVTHPSHAALIGMGDQSEQLFADARFTDLKKVKVVRYIAPWDVENDEQQRMRADAWIAAAKAKGYRVHVSFNYSARTPLRLPSVNQYTKATTAFVKRHRRDVESWGVFNEANRGFVKGRFRTPGAKRAAEYFNAFRTKVCRGCRVVGLDLLDGQSIKPTLRYVKTFKRYAKVQPKIWGFHNYSDANRNSMARTSALLKEVKGKVWLTETGGLYRLGSSFKPSAARQARAVRNVFAIAKKYKRIERVYFYNFYAPGADREFDIFDAGLIDGEGNTRSAYTEFKKRAG